MSKDSVSGTKSSKDSVSGTKSSKDSVSENITFKCEKCEKEFTEKTYKRHIERTTPCISEKKLKERISSGSKEVKERIIQSESIIENPQIKIDDSKLNAIDLFCGCGGMSEGLEKAGINVVAGIDFWDKAIENYKKNHNHLGICQDLTQFPPEKFNELYNKNNHSIDLLTGSPPCQSMSMAGKRDINDPRDSLFMEYVKYLNFFNPKVFIMENVVGMLSKKTDSGEKVIDIIMTHLNKNYNTVICKLYASDFEVPQNRRRVIIIGIRKDLKIIPSEPEPISKENRPPVKNILLPRNQIESSYYLSEKALQGIANKKINSEIKGAGFGAQYLDLEKPSYTIPARYWKDGYDALVKYSEKEVRRLTILELKRIQSFPDSYILEGSKKDIIMQIGNAVACKFAYHLGKHIIKLLEK